MDFDPGELSELERAIARFETATARHRRQREPVVTRPTPWRMRSPSALVVVAAAILSTSLTAVVLSVPDNADRPTEPVSELADADHETQTRARPEVPREVAAVAHVPPGTPARRTERVQEQEQKQKLEAVAPAIRFVTLAPPPPVVDMPLLVRRPQRQPAVEAVAPAGAPGDSDSAARRTPITVTNAPPLAMPTLPEDVLETKAPHSLGAPPEREADQLPVRLTDLPCALPLEPGGPAAAWAADAPSASSLTVHPLPIRYRGVMTTAVGTPRVGLVTTIFALYQAPAGGIPLWVDIKMVQTSAAGAYTVWLGQPTPFPPDLFAAGAARWLGVQPEGDGEQPRLRITDTPCGRPTPVVPSPATRTAPPPLIPYRGVLHDTAGVPLVGLVSAIFAFYEEAAGGLPLWVDIKTVQTGAAGGYTVLLGGTTEFPANLFTTGAARWLGVQPDGQAEQTRVHVVGPSPRR